MTLHNLFSLNFSSEIQDTFLLNAQKLKIFKRWSMSSTYYFSEAARANAMTGGLDLSFGFPWNGKIPYPHQVTWSQPINRRLTEQREHVEGKLKSLQMPKFEQKPAKVAAGTLARVSNKLPFFESCIVLEAFSLPARGFRHQAWQFLVVIKKL